MKILIACDSFKGTLTSIEVCNAIEKGMKKVLKQIEFTKVPMADGGEGTVKTLITATKGEIIWTNVLDPLGRERKAYFGIMGDKKTAIIEMAEASGLWLLKENEKNPLLTTTYGTGQLIKEALNSNIKKILLAIGGSATVDGGVGMAQALGIRFIDEKNKDIKFGGGELRKIKDIDISNMDKRLKDVEFIIACDVNNPLIGENGAAKVYGPQKGANSKMVEILEEGLKNLADIIEKKTGKKLHKLPGTGAAGGISIPLLAFCNACLKPGVEIVIDILNLEEKIRKNDLIITGEGQIDYQTTFGKVPIGISKIAKKYSIPVIAINGSIGKKAYEVHSYGINAFFSCIPKPMNFEEIKSNAYDLLVQTSEQIANLIKIFINSNK